MSARLKGISTNMRAWLDTLAWCEGTSTSRYTKDDGYDVIVNGIDNSPKIMTSYRTHPNIRVKVNNAGLVSTAAGRYQVLKKYWNAYSVLLKLPDFSPENQDRIAIQQIKEFRAIDLIEAGRINQAIVKIGPLWASLPGSGNNQPERDLNAVIARFVAFGGTLTH